MKKVRLLVWILIIALAAVVIYQNRGFFLDTKQSLAVDLPYTHYQSREVELVIIFGIFFAAGLLVGLYFLMSRGLKRNKVIKSLKAQVKAQTEKMVVLEEELRALRGDPMLPDTSVATDPALPEANSTQPVDPPPSGEKPS
ncbi:MAG: LapA family protein [Desulfobacterales bacterium]